MVTKKELDIDRQMQRDVCVERLSGSHSDKKGIIKKDAIDWLTLRDCVAG